MTEGGRELGHGAPRAQGAALSTTLPHAEMSSASAPMRLNCDGSPAASAAAFALKSSPK